MSQTEMDQAGRLRLGNQSGRRVQAEGKYFSYTESIKKRASAANSSTSSHAQPETVTCAGRRSTGGLRRRHQILLQELQTLQHGLALGWWCSRQRGQHAAPGPAHNE